MTIGFSFFKRFDISDSINKSLIVVLCFMDIRVEVIFLLVQSSLILFAEDSLLPFVVFNSVLTAAIFSLFVLFSFLNSFFI